MIKVYSSGFQTSVGWTSTMSVKSLYKSLLMLKKTGRKRIFDILGFVEETNEGECSLRPPITDNNTLKGKQNRRKLLRAWVEIHAWLADFKRSYGDSYHRPFKISY